MNFFKYIYSAAGRLAYRLLLPVLRLYLRRSRRVYIAVLCGDEVLALRSWLSSGSWHLPGGGIRKKELAADAAKRELLEEVGVELPSVLLPLAGGIWETRRLNYHYKILKAEISEKPSLKLRKLEILEARWFKLKDFDKENTPLEIKHALRQLSVGRSETSE